MGEEKDRLQTPVKILKTDGLGALDYLSSKSLHLSLKFTLIFDMIRESKGHLMESASASTLDPTAAPLPESAPSVTSLPQSVALRRLMEEVRFDEANSSSAGMAYDRAHNRHNRS